MFKRPTFLLAMFGGLLAAQTAPAPQPVLIVLYSRFYDHSQPHTTDERLQRLLPMLDKLRKQDPQAALPVLLQFSGTVAQELDQENPGLHLVDQIKEYSQRRLAEVGYTGEDEPSYLYRPKANLLLAETPEARWTAKADAADRFLNDFKNPVTGLPVPGLSGGLKRTQEVFGSVAFVTGASAALGADSPSMHYVRRMDPTAVIGGIPPSNPKNAITGFEQSADAFSRFMSPDPVEAPEVFWEDNLLRLSSTSLPDYKPHSTDEGPEAIKKFLDKLDRGHIRIVKLEVSAYRRYLTRRADGSVVADPLEWMYYHPDEPLIPSQLHAMVGQNVIEAGDKQDEATLKWLLETFLPANPGSRFISVRELAEMAVKTDSQISDAQVKDLATNLNGQFAYKPMEAPDFARAGSSFFSLAESFSLLAQSLAGFEKTGSLPKSVALKPVYGPFMLPNDMGPAKGSLPVSAVIKAAAQLAPKLADAEWKPVPSNAVPPFIQVGDFRLNATQFLRLMAQAYLDPSPAKTLSLVAATLTSRSSFTYPKNTPITDQGNAWTFKPAPLRVGAVAAGSR